MRRAIDVLVYGAAAVPLGLGVLMLQSIAVVALMGDAAARRHLADPAAITLGVLSLLGVGGGAAAMMSRFRYVRENPLQPDRFDQAGAGGTPVFLPPLQKRPLVIHSVEAPAVESPRRSTQGVDAVAIAIGASGLTIVLALVVPFAFLLSASAVGVVAGSAVALLLLAAGVLGYRRLHELGDSRSSTLGLREDDAPHARTISPGLVIAGSIVVTLFAVLVMLASTCGNMRM